jgi:tetratricopeptide (TPR) repeat protein
VTIAALASAWAIWQPERSAAQANRALELLAARKLPAAASAADDARKIDALSPDPLLAAAAVADARGDRGSAEADLVRAVRRFPGDPQVWIRLADYQLNSLGRAAEAARTVGGALFLDRHSRPAQDIYFTARLRLQQAANGAAAPVGTKAPGANVPGATSRTTPGPVAGKPAGPTGGATPPHGLRK